MTEISNEKFEFKAEIKQLLNIITHSLYSNREIFLRELISNASDALEKLRFEINKGTEVYSPEEALDIKITLNKDNRLITVEDTGIGMTKDEIIKDIGTIAHSGSAEFLKNALENSDNPSSIIGKFGVGFYSVFMIAEKVTIRSRSFIADAKPIFWESDGIGTYIVRELDGYIKRGTSVEITLKEDAAEFADEFRVKSIIKKHSNFIPFPIMLSNEKINTVEALWREPKFSIKEEQYDEFYKFLTYDTEKPFDTVHLSIDAPVQFTSLMFIPSKNTDIVSMDRDKYGLDLYVKRVLIQNRSKELIPEYLGFVRGVVDTEDLPLNISRETLQENILIRKISSTITKQVLNKLKKIAEDNAEKYNIFWNEHGKRFKLGFNDFANRDSFSELLRFNSSKCSSSEELISLDEYVSRIKGENKEIFYISGPSRAAVEMSPHLEIFRKKGIEVLYLFDTIDEFALENLMEYKKIKFISTENADIESIEKLENTEDIKKAKDLNQEESVLLDKLIIKIKEILADRVKDVRKSQRLSDSPSCLVSPDGTSSQMQKIMQMMHKDSSIPKKIFEINPDHELIRNLIIIFKKNEKDEFISTAVEQLFESSLLSDGYLNDPHKMVARINNILSQASGWYKDIRS